MQGKDYADEYKNPPLPPVPVGKNADESFAELQKNLTCAAVYADGCHVGSHGGKHIGQQNVRKERQKRGNTYKRRNAYEEVARFLVKILRIIRVPDIAERTVERVDAVQLYLYYFVSEQQAERRMAKFMHGRAECARYIADFARVRTEIFVKALVAVADE